MSTQATRSLRSQMKRREINAKSCMRILVLAYCRPWTVHTPILHRCFHSHSRLIDGHSTGTTLVQFLLTSHCQCSSTPLLCQHREAGCFRRLSTAYLLTAMRPLSSAGPVRQPLESKVLCPRPRPPSSASAVLIVVLRSTVDGG